MEEKEKKTYICVGDNRWEDLTKCVDAILGRHWVYYYILVNPSKTEIEYYKQSKRNYVIYLGYDEKGNDYWLVYSEKESKY